MRRLATIALAAGICVAGEAWAQTTREVMVYFGSDSIKMADEAEAVVMEARSIALNCDATAIRIVGHDDSGRLPEASRYQSEQRAENVRKLMTEGNYFDPKIFQTEHRGADDPVVKTPIGAREPLNRRVVITITCK